MLADLGHGTTCLLVKMLSTCLPTTNKRGLQVNIYILKEPGKYLSHIVKCDEIIIGSDWDALLCQ